MNDHDLIDELRDGMRARTSDTEVPDGFADLARRTARWRSSRRVAAAGSPLLAAAGVATLLATSAGSGHSSARRAPVLTGGGGHVHDTAYIINRVKAAVSHESHSSDVILLNTYASGHVSSDGSLVDLGANGGYEYEYTAPDGTEYLRNGYDQLDGSPYLTLIDVLRPDVDGRASETVTIVNPVKHTYSRHTRSLPGTRRGADPLPSSLYNNPSEVQRALRRGKVTETGRATVNGTPAIALSIKLPGMPPNSVNTLYVDAQTYQPLRQVASVDGQPGLSVTDWAPATPANVAKAKDDSIPSGYRKVARAARL